MFLAWQAEFGRRCRTAGWIDRSGLQQKVIALIEVGHLTLPDAVSFAGFDRLMPLQQRLADALAARGSAVEIAPPAAVDRSECRVLACADLAAECAAVASWAKAWLMNSRIAASASSHPTSPRSATAWNAVVDDTLQPAMIRPDAAELPRPLQLLARPPAGGTAAGARRPRPAGARRQPEEGRAGPPVGIAARRRLGRGKRRGRRPRPPRCRVAPRPALLHHPGGAGAAGRAPRRARAGALPADRRGARRPGRRPRRQRPGAPPRRMGDHLPAGAAGRRLARRPPAVEPRVPGAPRLLAKSSTASAGSMRCSARCHPARRCAASPNSAASACSSRKRAASRRSRCSACSRAPGSPSMRCG